MSTPSNGVRLQGLSGGRPILRVVADVDQVIRTLDEGKLDVIPHGLLDLDRDGRYTHRPVWRVPAEDAPLAARSGWRAVDGVPVFAPGRSGTLERDALAGETRRLFDLLHARGWSPVVVHTNDVTRETHLYIEHPRDISRAERRAELESRYPPGTALRLARTGARPYFWDGSTLRSPTVHDEFFPFSPLRDHFIPGDAPPPRRNLPLEAYLRAPELSAMGNASLVEQVLSSGTVIGRVEDEAALKWLRKGRMPREDQLVPAAE